MAIGHHVIFGAYGFWLPNDPRGSWSKFVGSWELFRFGRATTTAVRHSVAHEPHDRDRRLAAKSALQRPAVRFTGLQARAIGRGIAADSRRAKLPVWACAILPDHVHLVLGPHRLGVHQIVIQLKGDATRQLIHENLHPFEPVDGRRPKCFARGHWRVFLDTEDDVARAIRYVEENPIREGLPPQRWTFVTPPG